MKKSHREFIITDQNVLIVGAEKQKDGPNRGKYVKVIKRKIPYSKITGVTLSTLADDFFVLHVSDDYDSVMENFLKTELITVLSENYTVWAGKPLSVKFQDVISYTVKKTTWQSGGTCELRFVPDSSLKFAVPKNNGKSCEIRCPVGLPKDSRPSQNTLFEKKKVVTQQSSRTNAPTFTQTVAAASQAKVPAYSSPASNLTSSNPNLVKTPLSNSQNNMIGGSNRGSPYQSGNNLAASNPLAAAAAAKKKPPPPMPPAKKVPKCKALYVSKTDTRTMKPLKLMN
jgi:myosin I